MWILGCLAGVRNSVGFDWDDADNLWASSNARDNLDPDHNNRPDDPLLFIPDGTEPNTLDFGYPYCHWWVYFGLNAIFQPYNEVAQIALHGSN